MNQPARESRLNRFHLIVTIITSLLAAALGVFSVVKQNQAQELTVNVEGLSEDLDSARAERDQLSEEVVELESELAGPGEGEGETVQVDTDYLALTDQVGMQECTNGFHSGEWNADLVRFQGQDQLHAFSCIPYVNNPEDPLPIGFLDFLVADGATRLTGIAGMDENSGDTTMTAEFVVQTVPESPEPLFVQAMSFGEIAEFDVDVTGHTRVRLQVEVLSTEKRNQFEPEDIANASWADVRFA